jgi:hypothetical protein
MRLCLLAPLGIAALLGVMAIDPPDARAQARETTIVSSPRGTAVITRPSRRTALWRGMRGARGAVICRTVIVNGVRVRRCR